MALVDTNEAHDTQIKSGNVLTFSSSALSPRRTSSVLNGKNETSNFQFVAEYFMKMKGQGDKPIPVPSPMAIFIMCLASFLSIGTLSLIKYLPASAVGSSDYTDVLGSFGASAVLIYGAPNAPLSAPRNQIFGQFVAAVIGIMCRLWIVDSMDGNVGLALPVSITLCIFVQAVTQCFHPPAGGTNLIMVLSPTTSKIGFGQLVPVTYGTLVMFGWGLLCNNLNPENKYPLYWFGFKNGCLGYCQPETPAGVTETDLNTTINDTKINEAVDEGVSDDQDPSKNEGSTCESLGRAVVENADVFGIQVHNST